MLKTLKAMCCISVIVLFSACNDIDLYQNLTEGDANEMLVLLSENGIDAEKKEKIQQNEMSYSIAVAKEDMAKARSLLVQYNLPRHRELGLSGVYSDKGLIPTPDEQKARYLLALKGEIINSLESIPNIVDAEVVLNIPKKNDFASEEVRHQQRPTASVVLKFEPTIKGLPPVSESKLQEFVANAVEGMNPRDVTVIISYLPEKDKHQIATNSTESALPIHKIESEHPKTDIASTDLEYMIGLYLEKKSKNRLKTYLLIFFLVLILLSATLIIVIVQLSRMRRLVPDMSLDDQSSVDGELMDESPAQLTEGESFDMQE